MKVTHSIVTSAIVIGMAFGTLGCSGGGGGSSSSSSTTTQEVTQGETSVAGLTGDTTDDGTTSSIARGVDTTPQGSATLIVDANKNGLFDDSDDVTYTAPVIGGKFSFENIVVDANSSLETTALLTVTKDGFAPYHEVLSLKNGSAVSVMAKIDKPVLTEVIDLSSLSDAQRATSFVQFGTRDGGNGLESFSKLMSLSEFKAMADVNLAQAGTQSSSIIPVGAFASDVEKVTVDMQSFNSSDPEDFAAFPGKLSGHGKTTSRSLDSEETPLESAGFDLLKLTDQNGDLIELQPVATSKLSALLGEDTAVCGGMQWTRYLYSQEVAVIQNWGDDDNETEGYQVPIWSNDNATGSWQYVAEATVIDLNGSNPYFSVCVDKKWEGYLNCDSEIATSVPKQICLVAQDQDGNAMSNISVRSRKGGSYSRTYTDNEGHGYLSVKDNNITGWNYSYSGTLTGWRSVDIDPSSLKTSTQDGCDYDMNLTIENPYTTQLHVSAFAMNDDNNETPLTYARVLVSNNTYSDYYYKYAYTDENGEAVFDIKPDVTYTVTYKAGTSDVKADSVIVGNEQNDTTREVTVRVKDENKKPVVYVNAYSYNVSELTKTMTFTVSARDANRDPLTFKGLKLDTTPLVEGKDYNVSSTYSYDGYYYMRGVLNLDSATLSNLGATLAARENAYTLSAEFSDGNVNESDSDSFEVRENSAPDIRALYLKNTQTNRYYYSSATNIPDGNYTLYASVYDRDGDSVTITYDVSGTGVVDSATELSFNGDYSVTISATDGNKSTSQTYSFHAGNHAPIIYSSGSNDYFVNSNGVFQLYAYAYDSDYDALSVIAKASNGKEYNLTRPSSYGAYRSTDINIADVAVNGTATFDIYAFDGEVNSSVTYVEVKENANPVVSLTVLTQDSDLFTGQPISFQCSAQDPEGTALLYSWSVNGKAVSSYTNRYSATFSSSGTQTVSCLVKDRDGGQASDSVSVTIIDKGTTSPDDETTLKDMLASKTVYSAINNDPNTMESWTFNDDFTQVTVQELEGGNGSESLEISAYDATTLSVVEKGGETTSIEVVDTLSDYVLVSINGEDPQRVYFNEDLARAYFLSAETLAKAAISSDVTALMTPNVDADVASAKNLVAQLREASDSFIDVTNDMNDSTIVGSQYSALVDNIAPKVDTIASDLNESVAAFDICLSSFATTLESDFNTTLNALGARLDAIGTVIDAHEDNSESWEETTDAGDTLKHTYDKSGTTVTEVYSINDMNVTAVYEDTEDGMINSVEATGLIRLADEGYDVNITALTFDGSDADFTMNAKLTGDNDASMDLKQLSMRFKAGDMATPFDYFTDIEITLDGTVVTGGRTLQGTLTLDDNDQLNNKLVGSMQCLKDEPSFTGSVNINMPLSALKAIAKDDDEKIDNDWMGSGLLFEAEFEDGSRSFIINYISSYDYDDNTSTSYHYFTMQTQADTNVSCVATDNWSESSVVHTFECNDNVKILPYIGYNNIVTINAQGEDMKVSSIWWNSIYHDAEDDEDDYYSYELNMYIEDEGDAYYDADTDSFVLNGDTLVVDSVNARKAQSYEDYDFDVSIQGTLSDGDKVIAAKIGLNNIASSFQAQLYAADINITDGDDVLSAQKIAYGMKSNDMRTYLEYDGLSGNEYWMYYGYDESEWIRSYFTSYTINYDDYDEFKSDETSDYITVVAIENLHLNVTDSNDDTLKVDANISYLKDEQLSVNFDGAYSYKETSFLGHIDAKGDDTNDSLTLDAYVDGKVSANGYEPFSLASVVTIVNNDITADVLFTRGEDPVYKLGIAIDGNLDANTSVQLADSNGVLGTYVIQADSNESFGFVLTNKDGDELAKVGESEAGNSWEIQYADDTSETLY